jgi:hypothetical protein
MYLTSDPASIVLAGSSTMVVLRGSDKLPSAMFVGRSYVVRHAVYGGDAVNLNSVDGAVMDRVHLWSAPGMGFYSSSSTDVTLIDSGTCRAGDLPVSVTADASHFNECLGQITLDRVHFEGQGDDGTNVHGVFHAVLAVSTQPTIPTVHPAGGNTVTLTLGSRPAGGTSPLHPNEVYEFRNRTTWAIEGQGTLISASTGPTPLTQTATFLLTPGTVLSTYSLLTDITRAPAVLIRDSFFGNNRARGVLVKTSNAIITGSTFGPTTGPCVQAFPDG